ncbi:MAG: hypothetical protein ACRDGQ_02000 [Candidatus Limnocylindrales bacterium]
MAMLRVEPTPVHVKTDWLDGRPREIIWADERLPITSHNLVREEQSAYPVETGPRSFFELQTPRVRFQVTYLHRLRRWIVEAADQVEPRGLAESRLAA